MDTNEQQQLQRASIRWQLWFAVSMTAFLVVTFVWFLPLRFLYQASRSESADEATHDASTTEDVHGERGEALEHESSDIREGLAVDMSASPAPTVGRATWFDFFVNEKPANAPIPAEDIEIEHEKSMHVIGVRSDMEEFFHIHPLPDSASPGHLVVPHTFAAPGIYKLWTEVKRGGVIHAIGQPEFVVNGPGSQSAKSVSFARNIVVGNYQVALELDEPVAESREAELAFDIHTLTGDEVEVESYLGAAMHLAVIKDDWTEFVHTHPVRGDDGHASQSFDADSALFLKTTLRAEGASNGTHPGRGDMHEAGGLIPRASAHGEAEETADVGDDHGALFHVIFPEAGLYRAFAQFRPAGADLSPEEALTAAFWIRIEEQAPFFSNWWLRLFVSLVLIVALSWGVRRYLEAPVAGR